MPPQTRRSRSNQSENNSITELSLLDSNNNELNRKALILSSILTFTLCLIIYLLYQDGSITMKSIILISFLLHFTVKCLLYQSKDKTTSSDESFFDLKILNTEMKKDVTDLNDILRENSEEDQPIASDFQESILKTDAPLALVFDFEGDGEASETEDLRKFVSFAIEVLDPKKDRVVLQINSGGGEVSAYGLASAQVLRLRQANLTVITCVDRVAASGGYLMCVPSSYILASSFAWIGSIGVLSSFLNFNRLLQQLKIDPVLFTAGKHKRSVTELDPITEEGKGHKQKQINNIHRQFSNWVSKYRNGKLKVNLDEITNGDCWSAEDALKLGLIDEIGLSDQYIEKLKFSHRVISVEKKEKPKTSIVSKLIDSIDFLICFCERAFINFKSNKGIGSNYSFNH
jgi:serine protease SohB